MVRRSTRIEIASAREYVFSDAADDNDAADDEPSQLGGAFGVTKSEQALCDRSGSVTLVSTRVEIAQQIDVDKKGSSFQRPNAPQALGSFADCRPVAGVLPTARVTRKTAGSLESRTLSGTSPCPRVPGDAFQERLRIAVDDHERPAHPGSSQLEGSMRTRTRADMTMVSREASPSSGQETSIETPSSTCF